MPINHIVLFEFKPTVGCRQAADACRRMLDLPQTCFHPNQPYVKGCGGGRDTSLEGLQGAFKQGFVSEFQSEEDRKYYLEKDPAHLEFVASLNGLVENVRWWTLSWGNIRLLDL